MANEHGLFDQVQKLQTRMRETQAELAEDKVRYTNEAKNIKITLTADLKLTKIKIKHEDFTDDPDSLEPALVETVNQAIVKAQAEAAAKLTQVSGGFGGLETNS